MVMSNLDEERIREIVRAEVAHARNADMLIGRYLAEKSYKQDLLYAQIGASRGQMLMLLRALLQLILDKRLLAEADLRQMLDDTIVEALAPADGKEFAGELMTIKLQLGMRAPIAN
jgi:hypothetical protein